MEQWSIEQLDTVDSTNTLLKKRLDAAHGTVVVAARQSAGRGRLGRSFSSPRGVYLSVLLHRDEPPSQLLHLTAMTAVAVRRAILDASGVPTQIKWVNDLILCGKKLCGILVEHTGDGRYIVGVGINCNTDLSALPPEVEEMAASLRCDEKKLILALVSRLREMDEKLLSARRQWMAEYAANCVTVGKAVQLLRGEERVEATALGVDENAALLVRYPDGKTDAICSGEVSVRGQYGYI